MEIYSIFHPNSAMCLTTEMVMYIIDTVCTCMLPFCRNLLHRFNLIYPFINCPHHLCVHHWENTMLARVVSFTPYCGSFGERLGGVKSKITGGIFKDFLRPVFKANKKYAQYAYRLCTEPFQFLDILPRLIQGTYLGL